MNNKIIEHKIRNFPIFLLFIFIFHFLYYINKNILIFNEKNFIQYMGIGDWGLGFGGWGVWAGGPRPPTPPAAPTPNQKRKI